MDSLSQYLEVFRLLGYDFSGFTTLMLQWILRSVLHVAKLKSGELKLKCTTEMAFKLRNFVMIL